jgi:hypothetical protein
MTKYNVPGTRRLMDRAHFTDKNGIEYSGEALLLALLVHTHGKTNRGQKEMREIQEILEDPNLD